MLHAVVRKKLFSIALGFAVIAFQLPGAKSSPRSINCGDFTAINRAQYSCDISQEAFAINGKLGMIVNVRFNDLTLAGKYPDAPSLGITRRRYFYINDCEDRGVRVPIKNGFEDMPFWSNGWLICPIEQGGLNRKIIYNENMEPLYWIANIFF